MSTAAGLDRGGPIARVLDDPRVVVAEMDPRDIVPEAGLYPEEAAAIQHAVLSRRQQFTAGRCLARQAWQALGHAPEPLLSDAQRVPRWPAGLLGTITHTQGWCGAAVALASAVGGLGADVETATPLELGLWERVCRPEERAFLRAQPAALQGLLAKGIFSAKESIYKALYPAVRVFLDFQGMSIALTAHDAAEWRWHATLQVPWGAYAEGQRFGAGRLRLEHELIVSAVIV